MVPQACKCKVCQTLAHIKYATLTRTNTDIPSLPIDDIIEDPNKDEDLIPPNERRPMRMLDARRQGDGELSDSDDEGEGGRRDHASHKDSKSASASVAGGDDASTHKFGIGVGIMSSGQAGPTGGAGPSGHTTAPIPTIDETPTTSNSRAASTAMDVDDGTSASAANTGAAVPSPAPAPEPEAKAKLPEVVAEDMAVDPPAPPAALETPAESS